VVTPVAAAPFRNHFIRFRKVTDMTISIAQSTRRWLARAVVIAATAAALPTITSSAFAADMPAQPRPQGVERPLWTGFYFGVHGGGGWGNTRIEDPNFAIAFDPVSVKSSGPLAGAQLGANWQLGNIVVGGELDASWASITGEGQSLPPFGFTSKFRALATGTARVGYAAGSWLAYAKGGVAWADLEVATTMNGVRRVYIEHQRTGLAAGAGLEWAFFGNLSAKLEYNFLYFGETSMALGAPLGNSSNVDHFLHLVKGGLNLRFGGDSVVARY
jgi:outer membrane immunogenic protein